MSGPKVVTIVTREELIDACRALIASLENAERRWETAAIRSCVLSDDEIVASRLRISKIQTLLDNDRFLDVQKQVPAEIAFLDSDIERIAQQAVVAAAAARERSRRSVAAALMLRSELSSRGIEVPQALQAPESFPPSQLEAAVAKAFASLAPQTSPEALTDHQKSLAAFHGADESRLSFIDWLATVHVADVDPLVLKLESQLDELRVLAPARAESFSGKLSTLATEQTASRRTLLADSLTLEMAATKRSVLETTSLRSQLEDLGAEAEVLNFGLSSEIVTLVRATLEDSGVTASAIKVRIEETRKSLVELREEKVALQRRRSLLGGLSELGYNVQEGMETAWIKDGRVVISGGSTPGYGIEIGGNPDVALQVRSVAFSPTESRSVQEDKAAEETFCDDFARMRTSLNSKGGDVHVVKALGVGQARVKPVALELEQADADMSNSDIDRASTQSTQL